MQTSIIPIFIPHIGCPHRCVFCNQWQITGHRGVPSPDEVRRLIASYTASARTPRRWEVAFYGGSFTAISVEIQEGLLQPAHEALMAGTIDGIRCSTRPDCITPAILERLQGYGLTCVELGVQSMDDDVLTKARRGHTAGDVVAATELLRQYGFTVGHQLMPGLPGEDWDSLVRTTDAICRLQPDLARIYPVAVLTGTDLADSWRAGCYHALTIHEGVVRAAYMKQRFLEQGINCIRTGLQATEDLDDDTQVLAGAYTPAMGELVDTRRYGRQLLSFLRSLPVGPGITICYNRRDTSRVRGYRNVTVKTARWSLPYRLTWRQDEVPVGHIRVCQGRTSYDLDVNSKTGPTMI